MSYLQSDQDLLFEEFNMKLNRDFHETSKEEIYLSNTCLTFKSSKLCKRISSIHNLNHNSIFGEVFGEPTQR